ncbi:hypothetical protein DFJ73DRAFT_766160 [Zopfochytrium polystomum]|nr:hypothetical protein DFJ73DRAFT_766160 [Zopfochytrium polystomum]
MEIFQQIFSAGKTSLFIRFVFFRVVREAGSSGQVVALQWWKDSGFPSSTTLKQQAGQDRSRGSNGNGGRTEWDSGQEVDWDQVLLKDSENVAVSTGGGSRAGFISYVEIIHKSRFPRGRQAAAPSTYFFDGAFPGGRARLIA